MPTLVPEDGTGRADANSYVSLSEADAYHDESVRGSEWAGLDNDTKARALIEATRLLDAGWRWYGRRKKDDQALGWPRVGVPDPDAYDEEDIVSWPVGYTPLLPDDEVPPEIRRATAWLALKVVTQDLRADPPGVGLQSFALQGVMSVEFAGEQKDLNPIPRVLVELKKYGRPVGDTAVVKLRRA